MIVSELCFVFSARANINSVYVCCTCTFTHSPEKCVVVGVFSYFVTVTVALSHNSLLLPEALRPFDHYGHAFPDPLPQAFPPVVGDYANHPHWEAYWWKSVRVAHSQAGQDPDVARTQEAHLPSLEEKVLGLLVGAVGQQDLGVHLQ